MNLGNDIHRFFSDEDGIGDKTLYMNAAVMVLIIQQNGVYHFVFQKRAQGISQGGEISFPGGKIEPNETPKEAAFRETAEEMGIEASRIELLGTFPTFVNPSGMTVDICIGLAHVAFEEFQIQEDEVERLLCIPISYFIEHPPKQYDVLIQISPSKIDLETGKEEVFLPVKELGIPSYYEKPWGNFKHPIYVYTIEDEVIWGLTARFVYHCVERITSILENEEGNEYVW